MFQLSPDEFKNLKSQIVISSWGGARAAPYASTEQGVAMLSSVLRSPKAIQVNIEIMRVIVTNNRRPRPRIQIRMHQTHQRIAQHPGLPQPRPDCGVVKQLKEMMGVDFTKLPADPISC